MGRGWTEETTTMWTQSLEHSPTETKGSFSLSHGKGAEATPVAKELPLDDTDAVFAV